MTTEGSDEKADSKGRAKIGKSTDGTDTVTRVETVEPAGPIQKSLEGTDSKLLLVTRARPRKLDDDTEANPRERRKHRIGKSTSGTDQITEAPVTSDSEISYD